MVISLSQFHKIESINEQVWELMVIDGDLYCAHNIVLTIIDEKLNTTNPYSFDSGIFSIQELDNTDEVLLGTYVGLSKINLKSKEVVHFGELRESIKKVLIDHLGNVWLEHLNRGVHNF